MQLGGVGIILKPLLPQKTLRHPYTAQSVLDFLSSKLLLSKTFRKPLRFCETCCAPEILQDEDELLAGVRTSVVLLSHQGNELLAFSAVATLHVAHALENHTPTSANLPRGFCEIPVPSSKKRPMLGISQPPNQHVRGLARHLI